MSSKHDAIEEIAEVLDTLNEIISKYELEDEFAYVFCCAVPIGVNVFETEYTAVPLPSLSSSKISLLNSQFLNSLIKLLKNDSLD